MFEARAIPDWAADWAAETVLGAEPLAEDDVFDPATGLPWLRPELGWLAGTMTERLEWVCEQPPSPTTATALAVMSQEPMTADERMLFVRAWDRLSSWVAASLVEAEVCATAVEGLEGALADLEGDTLDRELALMLRRSDRSMAGELGFARRLTSLLPTTAALLASGDIALTHVRALDEWTGALTEEQVGELDATLAPRATALTPTAFRRMVRRAVEKLLPAPDERHARARRTQGARLFPEQDGMATLALCLPATDGVAVLNALNIAADRSHTPDDDRTHGQRQIAALLDRVLGTQDEQSGSGKVRAHRRTEVQVTIDWATLIGLRNEPADLAGFGAVPADAVRRLLSEPGTVLRRIVYDGTTGVLVDFGSARYAPDEHLLGLIRARDVTCRYPGCLRPAVWCEFEHCRPYDAGGATSAANGCLMCRVHHNLKTHSGFRYARPDPETGETVWTTPLGFRYRQAPAGYQPGGVDTGDTVREHDPPPF